MSNLVVNKKRDKGGFKTSLIPNHSQLKQVIMKTTSNVANIPIWQNLSLENLQGEIWKPIKGYEELYEVSNMGRVKSLGRFKKHPKGGLSKTKSRILKCDIVKGYPQYSLYKNAKSKAHKGHRIVAISFIENHQHKPCINHKNLIKSDNRVENLEWCSIRENTSHYYKSIPTESSYTGVCRNANKNKWISYMYLNGKRKHLGVFDSEEEASAEYKKNITAL